MNANRTSRWVLAAAVAAASTVPLFGLVSEAGAQYRIDTAGRALDANNRVGGGGQNPTNSKYDAVSGNDIVLGNVSGGKQFRGHVPYGDPNEFRGFTAGRASDNLVKQSAGPDTSLSTTVAPFYGMARGVAPPPDTQQIGATGAYVPSAPPQRAGGDLRMGSLYFAPLNPVPQPGELTMSGPVDPTAGQSMITASPLYGIRTWSAADGLPTLSNTQYNPLKGPLSDSDVQRMRSEMGGAAGGATGNGTNQNANPNAPGTDTGTGTGADAGAAATPGATPAAKPLITAKPLTPLVGNAADPMVKSQPLSGSISAKANDAGTDQSTRLRLLVKPEAQSAQYAEMLRLFKRQEQSASDSKISDAQAAQAYNQARQAMANAKNSGSAGSPGQPGQPGQTGQPAQPGQPGQTPAGGAMQGVAPGGISIPPPGGTNAGATGATGAVGATGAAGGTAAPGTDYIKRNEDLLKQAGKDLNKPKKPEPLKVKSFATGVKGKGLSELLSNAESLMKDGKFTSALDQYDAAEQVAPNNPMIRLGRANAELGASYYARAEAHLRDVFTSNPELLVGQYDLQALLGEERLQVLVKDLKDVANHDQKQARPVFLLAYIYYNIGQEQKAEAYLDLAERRSGGQDKFFKLLRENWTLASDKASAAPADATKGEKDKEMNLNK